MRYGYYRMRLSTFTLCATVCFFVAGLQPAIGQNSDSPQGETENDLYEAQGNLIIRDSPPGWFALKGNQIDVLRQGQKVVVEERRNVKDLFGEQEWLKIRDPEGRVSGWVYNGTTKLGTPYIVPQQSRRPESS